MGGGGLKKLLISAYDKTDRLREMRTRGREGGQNSRTFCVSTKWKPPNRDIKVQSVPKYIYKVLVSPRKTFRKPAKMGEKRNIHVLNGNLVNLF